MPGPDCGGFGKKRFAGDVFESYSACTEIKDYINQDAVRLMKHLYGIEMKADQHSKLISDIPSPDIVITMGCNVSCPSVLSKNVENWGLEGPPERNPALIPAVCTISARVAEPLWI